MRTPLSAGSTVRFRGRLSLRRVLAAGMVDGIIRIVGPGEKELGHGEQVVALLQEGLDDAGQRLRSVEGGVVKEDDGPGLDLGGDPLGDLAGRELLPVCLLYTSPSPRD